MKNKKVWMCLGVLALIIIIAIVYTKSKGAESTYVRKCPCPGVVISGKPGEVYYNTACCKKAVSLSGSASGTGVA